MLDSELELGAVRTTPWKSLAWMPGPQDARTEVWVADTNMGIVAEVIGMVEDADASKFTPGNQPLPVSSGFLVDYLHDVVDKETVLQRGPTEFIIRVIAKSDDEMLARSGAVAACQQATKVVDAVRDELARQLDKVIPVISPPPVVTVTGLALAVQRAYNETVTLKGDVSRDDGTLYFGEIRGKAIVYNPATDTIRVGDDEQPLSEVWYKHATRPFQEAPELMSHYALEVCMALGIVERIAAFEYLTAEQRARYAQEQND